MYYTMFVRFNKGCLYFLFNTPAYIVILSEVNEERVNEVERSPSLSQIKLGILRLRPVFHRDYAQDDR